MGIERTAIKAVESKQLSWWVQSIRSAMEAKDLEEDSWLNKKE